MNTEITPPTQFSIFGTVIWMLFLTLGLQTIVVFIAAVGFGASGMPMDELDKLVIHPIALSSLGLITALMAWPLVKKASFTTGKPFPLEFLAIKPIERKTLLYVLGLGAIYFTVSAVVNTALEIEVPQFMYDLKEATKSPLDIVALIFGLCVIAPIVEEVIFRGLAYQRLANSKLGHIGTIVFTSLIFTIIHTQYEIDVLASLAVFAFLLGYIRYKTGNTSYCIVLHFALNSLAVVEILFFL